MASKTSYQSVKGTVEMFFETHEELVNFVNKVSNIDWEEYRKQQARRGAELPTKLLETLKIESNAEDLQSRDCTKVKISIDYEHDVDIVSCYSPATMLTPEEFPSLGEFLDTGEILSILDDFASSLGAKVYDWDDKLLKVDDEEEIWCNIEEKNNEDDYGDFLFDYENGR